MKTALMLFLCLPLISGCITAGLNGQDKINYVEVAGSGEIEAVADRFVLRATAEARGEEVVAIKRQVDAQVDTAATAIQALGIGRDRLKALTLQVQPEWQWEPRQKLIGYVANRDMELEIDGLEKYTAVLSALANAGISRIRPANAEVSNAEALGAEALALAVEDARRKAGILAASADRTLGPALMIVESGGGAEMPRMSYAMKAEADSYYNPGTSRIQRQVQVRFRLD